jgi:hypothetical protein
VKLHDEPACIKSWLYKPRICGIIASTKEVIYLPGLQEERVEDITTRTMQRAAEHSVLIVLLMSGKWRITVFVYLLNLYSCMHTALFGPVYIHTVAHWLIYVSTVEIYIII